jgi:hypothetical protein
MSLALKSTVANFAIGLGRHADPLVAQSDLLSGWDFKDFSNWKVGLVAGQRATAFSMTGAKTENDAQISRSLDGMGLRISATGLIEYGFSLAPFSNMDSAGFTMMALLNAPMNVTYGGSRWGRAFDFGQVGIGSQHTASGPSDYLSFGPKGSYAKTIVISKAFHGAYMAVMRGNGDGTWTFNAPNARRVWQKTHAETGVAEPVVTWSGANAGKLVSGNPGVDNTVYGVDLTLYQGGVWNRRLTDAEVSEQIQRSLLRFPGVMM